jgi:SAM-dependent methyltransferase
VDIQAQAFEDRYANLRERAYPGWGGANYDRRFEGWRLSLERLQKRIEQPIEEMKVVELGCGNGMASYLLAQNGAQSVYGVDFSETAIAWAQERFGPSNLSGNFQVGHVCDMPFYADGTFDLVIDGNCLHCIIGPDRPRFFSEIRRILRPGGYVLVSSMCGPPKTSEARSGYDPALRCLTNEGRPVRFMPSPESLLQECLAAGFDFLAADLSCNDWWDHLELLLVRR